MLAPVFEVDGKTPLMPIIPSCARRWIETGKATPFWKRGVFCVRLNIEPSARNTQPIAVGIDPGSQKEGITVKSEVHTYLNLQADAVTWVKNAVETRRNMRRARRYRKTPCRQNRRNRALGRLAPSTKARWQWKLRLCQWLAKLYPIACFVVEDVKAHTEGGRRWNKSFSPLQVGKDWFYSELGKIAKVETKLGYEIKVLKDAAGLKKTSHKLAEVFTAHCVDSWVLANWWTGGHVQPDNTRLTCITPLRFHRRQLHCLQPEKSGNHKPYGGILSHGLKRGSLVKHVKLGLTYVDGYLKDRISLHSLTDGKRLCQNAKPSDCTFLAFNAWKTRLLPCLKAEVRRASLTISNQ
jgi:RRXRR protein